MLVRQRVGKGVFVCRQDLKNLSVFKACHVCSTTSAVSQSGQISIQYIALVMEHTAAISVRRCVKTVSHGYISGVYSPQATCQCKVKQATVPMKMKFVYISPVSLALPKYRDMLCSANYQQHLSVFATVETHCMLIWYVTVTFTVDK